MYVDVKGLVTTGVGNLIDPISLALELPWKHRGNGSLATPEEVSAAWHALKSQKDKYARLHWKYAAELNDLRLTDEDIDALVASKLADFEAHLKRHHFHEWDSFPADAQLGICSMAWACGPGFPETFKNFAKAAVAQDWIAAKASCTIRTEGNPGVVPRNRNNERCFENAADVLARGIDRSLLYWPGTVPESTRPIAPPLSASDRARVVAHQFDPLDLDGDGFPDPEAITKSDPPERV